MPTTTESRAVSAAARPRCTDVVRIIEATALEAAVAGEFCALSLFSPLGTTRVLIPTPRFIEGARGPRDCNGHPFPEIVGGKGRTLALLENDAVQVETGPAIDSLDGRYSRAWEYLAHHPQLPVAIAATRCSVSTAGFRKWLSLNRRGQLRRIRLAAGVSQRPQGMLPSETDGSRPILKPSGRIL